MTEQSASVSPSGKGAKKQHRTTQTIPAGSRAAAGPPLTELTQVPLPLVRLPLPVCGGLAPGEPQEAEQRLPCGRVWGPRPGWKGREPVREQARLPGAPHSLGFPSALPGPASDLLGHLQRAWVCGGSEGVPVAPVNSCGQAGFCAANAGPSLCWAVNAERALVRSALAPRHPNLTDHQHPADVVTKGLYVCALAAAPQPPSREGRAAEQLSVFPFYRWGTWRPSRAQPVPSAGLGSLRLCGADTRNRAL